MSEYKDLAARYSNDLIQSYISTVKMEGEFRLDWLENTTQNFLDATERFMDEADNIDISTEEVPFAVADDINIALGALEHVNVLLNMDEDYGISINNRDIMKCTDQLNQWYKNSLQAVGMDFDVEEPLKGSFGEFLGVQAEWLAMNDGDDGKTNKEKYITHTNEAIEFIKSETKTVFETGYDEIKDRDFTETLEIIGEIFKAIGDLLGDKLKKKIVALFKLVMRALKKILEFLFGDKKVDKFLKALEEFLKKIFGDIIEKIKNISGEDKKEKFIALVMIFIEEVYQIDEAKKFITGKVQDQLSDDQLKLGEKGIKRLKKLTNIWMGLINFVLATLAVIERLIKLIIKESDEGYPVALVVSALYFIFLILAVVLGTDCMDRPKTINTIQGVLVITEKVMA